MASSKTKTLPNIWGDQKTAKATVELKKTIKEITYVTTVTKRFMGEQNKKKEYPWTL